MLEQSVKRANWLGILALDASVLTLQAVTNPNSERVRIREKLRQKRAEAGRSGLWYKSSIQVPIGAQNQIHRRAMHTTANLDCPDLEESPAQAQKRCTSMIFRIEQLLPGGTSTSASVSTATIASQSSVKRSQTSLRPGVYTSQYTPKDTCSNGVDTSALLNSISTATPNNFHAYCTLDNGELTMSAVLLRQIKLSEDIYSFNALFELYDEKLRLRLIRDVAQEDEIVAWFGEELVILMGIPFLTPLNIQGNSRYTCHLCHLTFETPHPLKIHLALSCGRSVMDILWMRLHYALKSAARSADRTHAMSPIPATSSASSTSPNPSPPRATVSRLSAFRPMPTIRPLMIPINSPPPTSAVLSYIPPISMAAPLSAHTMNAAAQIEAIVSNMGASKQGHLCIYCGKVYSRKYGLKIHIRTHTGFKPLKCKFCLRPFGDPSNLNKHVRLHVQTQPSSSEVEINVDGDSDASFQCHLCSKMLARRRDLQQHIETQHCGGLVHATSSTSTATEAGATTSSVIHKRK